jgi:hypothetical protein
LAEKAAGLRRRRRSRKRECEKRAEGRQGKPGKDTKSLT